MIHFNEYCYYLTEIIFTLFMHSFLNMDLHRLMKSSKKNLKILKNHPNMFHALADGYWMSLMSLDLILTIDTKPQQDHLVDLGALDWFMLNRVSARRILCLKTFSEFKTFNISVIKEHDRVEQSLRRQVVDVHCLILRRCCLSCWIQDVVLKRGICRWPSKSLIFWMLCYTTSLIVLIVSSHFVIQCRTILYLRMRLNECRLYLIMNCVYFKSLSNYMIQE
jgi:hypothetical protein